MPIMSNHYENAGFWKLDTTESVGNDPVASLFSYLRQLGQKHSFSKGLTELMRKTSYTGDLEDIGEKTSFLCQKLSAIGIGISRSTVRDWFTDKRRPAFAANSRAFMYQICFVLGASLEDVQWFFHKVYFDRGFNCHTIEEAVYYYCFSNHLPYRHAQDLIQEIVSYAIPKDFSNPKQTFTADIQKQLDNCKTDKMLLSFFQQNKGVFLKWNQSASSSIHHYLSEIQGKNEDKAILKIMREAGKIPFAEREKCGLAIQELLFEYGNEFLQDISGKNIASIDFMLDCILHTSKGFSKHADIPEILQINFPNKKAFSDILHKADTSTSYDSIRKCLILLKFYHFWCSQKLHPDQSDHYTFDQFTDEANHLLTHCAYEEMYENHPYDCLFLWAASTEDPLGYLRDAVEQLL